MPETQWAHVLHFNASTMNSASVTCAASVCFCAIACGGQAANEGSGHPGEAPPPNVVANGSAVTATAPLCTRSPTSQTAEVWRQSFAEDNVLKATSVATDAEGNAYVARDEGETFKVSASGTVLWSKPFGSLVAVDSAENVIVTGTFSGSLDVGATSLVSAGGTDVFVAKLNGDGSVLYGVALGTVGDESAGGLAVGPDGSVVVSGPGLGTVQIDSVGQSQWQRDFYGSVAVDSEGNVLTTGALTGTVSFGGESLQSAGGEDIFVAKLDRAGNHLFSRRFGDAGQIQHGEAIAVDPSDNILVSGVLDGAVDFGGGPLSIPAGTCPTESWCDLAGFVVKLDPSGAHLWSRSRAPVRSIPGLASDSRGHVLASGAYPGNAPPYRTVLLLEFDENGNNVSLSGRLDFTLTDSGAGHRIAVDRCDNVLWSLSVPPTPGAESGATSFLAKLSL